MVRGAGEVGAGPRERSSKSKTGFVNVKLIKGKYYQAQLHISKKGCEDGGQKALPGMWKTALDGGANFWRSGPLEEAQG